MTLYLCYNNKTSNFLEKIQNFCSEKYPEIEVVSYSEDHFKEKKQAYKIKGGYSARMTPFMLLLGDDKKYVKAFYSENNGCSLEELQTVLNNL